MSKLLATSKDIVEKESADHANSSLEEIHFWTTPLPMISIRDPLCDSNPKRDGGEFRSCQLHHSSLLLLHRQSGYLSHVEAIKWRYESTPPRSRNLREIFSSRQREKLTPPSAVNRFSSNERVRIELLWERFPAMVIAPSSPISFWSSMTFERDEFTGRLWEIAIAPLSPMLFAVLRRNIMKKGIGTLKKKGVDRLINLQHIPNRNRPKFANIVPYVH